MSEKIRELAIIMHEKKTIMHDLHIASQKATNGNKWSAKDEADYQVSRVEYYKSKYALDKAIGEESQQ